MLLKVPGKVPWFSPYPYRVSTQEKKAVDLPIDFGSTWNPVVLQFLGRSLGKGVWRGKCVSESLPISLMWQNRNKHGISNGIKRGEKSSCFLELRDDGWRLPTFLKGIFKDLPTLYHQVITNASPRSNIPWLFNRPSARSKSEIKNWI